ncbi:MAG: hypothetical protein SX243_25480 [Acidobacteriota bacterium]|nr:hypothetical protein [Acidobacteriota bacterium]
MSLFLLSLTFLALAMSGLAVGVIISNRALRGSCGGVAVRGPDGEPLTCGNCNCRLPEEEDEALAAVDQQADTSDSDRSRPAA